MKSEISSSVFGIWYLVFGDLGIFSIKNCSDFPSGKCRVSYGVGAVKVKEWVCYDD